MKSIEFKIVPCDTYYPFLKDKCVILKIINNSDGDLHFSSDALMLDGFRSDKFQITEFQSGETVPYTGRFVKYHPAGVTVKAHNSLSSGELNLADYYDFNCWSLGQKFQVLFEAEATFCPGIDQTDCRDIYLHGELVI